MEIKEDIAIARLYCAETGEFTITNSLINFNSSDSELLANLLNQYLGVIRILNIKLNKINYLISKHLFSLLRIIEKSNMKNQITINWFYKYEHDDLYEIGRFYSSVIHTPFNFIKFQRLRN